MTGEDMLSVKYAVNTHMCLCACTCSTPESPLTCQSECAVVLMSNYILMDVRHAGGLHTSHIHVYTKVFISLIYTYAHVQREDISTQRLHSVTPRQIKTNGFI